MTFTVKSLGLSVVFCISLLVQIGNVQSQLGNPCMDIVECSSPLLLCVDFECVCAPPYVPNIENTRCAVDIDGRCQKSNDVCVDPNASCNKTLSVWDSSWCTCNDDYLQNRETRLCQPSLGSPCETGGLACIAGSCINEICQCEGNLVPSQNNDECGMYIGGTCTAAAPTCADPFAECTVYTGYICECREGYQSLMENNVKICGVALGAPCEVTSQCAPLNTSCETLKHGNGACTCVPGYVPSSDRTSCLPVTNQWPGTCQENLQCSAMFGRHSSCQDNACVCATGYVYVPEDFGCSPSHTAVDQRVYKSVKLLATTLLPYLPHEAQLAVEQILNEL